MTTNTTDHSLPEAVTNTRLDMINAADGLLGSPWLAARPRLLRPLYRNCIRSIQKTLLHTLETDKIVDIWNGLSPQTYPSFKENMTQIAAKPWGQQIEDVLFTGIVLGTVLTIFLSLRNLSNPTHIFLSSAAGLITFATPALIASEILHRARALCAAAVAYNGEQNTLEAIYKKDEISPEYTAAKDKRQKRQLPRVYTNSLASHAALLGRYF